MVRNMKNSNKQRKIISHTLADKKILWLSEHNKYLLANKPLDEIVGKVYLGEPDQSIVKFCVNDLGLELDESIRILKEVQTTLEKKLENVKAKVTEKEIETIKENPKFACRFYYEINEKIFLIEYESPEIEFFIHPKFAHLTISKQKNIDCHLQIYISNNRYYLVADGEKIGTWKNGEEHFLGGKVSMEILQKITNTIESDWMAVFHAAGIALNNEGILFLGDSGNGKSTLSAILMANGFNVLADDFLPVLRESGKMCSFPAGISVKKRAIEMLSTQFPELKNAKEYDFSAQGKTVRYLFNLSASHKPRKVYCKALVFVKYEPESQLEFKMLAKDEAFQALIPDSWISSKEKNVIQFMNWFTDLPCWKMTYSDNSAMVEMVKKIFENK